jgi:hypothetical protein
METAMAMTFGLLWAYCIEKPQNISWNTITVIWTDGNFDKNDDSDEDGDAYCEDGKVGRKNQDI